jgi:hypothetical protein
MLNLEALIADGNSAAARKARVALQPRDKYGRWVTTGASLFTSLKQLGKTLSVRGKAIGGTDKPGQIRMLVGKGYEKYGIKPNTVLTVNSTNGELFTGATLDRDYLKKMGIDPDLKHSLPEDVADQPQSLKQMDPKPADALDIDLATNGLDPKEDAPRRAERDATPLAKLPPALEAQAIEGQDVGKLVDGKQDVTPAIEGDTADGAISDAMAEAFYGGDVPSLDQIIDKASAPDAVEVALKDLKPGDVINLGNRGDKKVVRVDQKHDGMVDVWVDDFGREAKISANPLPGSAGVKKVGSAPEAPKKPVAEKPAKPVAPRKPAEKPAAPAAPKTAKATPKAKPAPKSEEVNMPDRKDDGKMIAPSSKSVEELRDKKINNIVDENGKLLKVRSDKGKLRAVEDPNAIIDALLEENPNAKIKPDGTVVVERGEFTDVNGKKYIYEVGVQRTVGNQFMERYTLRDAATGEITHDFYNADYKDSFGGLYGKTSGLTKTRDLLLGKAVPGLKGVDDKGVPVDPELSNYFGPGKSIDQRLKYMRKTKDMNNWRLLTPQENALKYITGRGRELNKSDVADGKNYKSQFGNVRRSFVASAFEAIDLRDNELLKERLVQALGRTPNTPESVDLLIDMLKKEIDKRYAGTPRHKELAFLPAHMKSFLADVQADLHSRNEVPFVSEDGVSVVKPGDRVRFINNEGDMVVGTVVKLNAGSGKNGGFKDTAKVKFGNQVVDNLQTRNMLHTEDEVTDYAPWVRNDEKLKRRATELGIDFEEYKRRKEDSPEGFDPESPEYAPADAGTPYIGEAGESGSDISEVSATKNAEDFVAGDAYYDENGDYIGTIQQIQSVPATDGGEPGIAIQYLDIDGNLQVEVLDRGDQRGPK